MKEDTMLKKLNALLGLDVEVPDKKKATNTKSNTVGVSENEIQSWREKQGIIYFLQAPELFQSKVCKHCGAHFLVSRLYVAYCSYTCIRASLAELGITWSKYDNVEYLIANIYDGNEPLWIKNTSNLTRALEKLVGENLLDSLDPTSPQGKLLKVPSQNVQSSSVAPSTPQSTTPGGSSTSPNRVPLVAKRLER